jgi:Fur family transcriptional regulator, ferric uptake regulator
MPGSNDESHTRIERLCAEHGLRMTDQRRVIARVLSQARDHPDVEEVYRRANAIDSKGMLERHDFGGRGRYEETARGHHDHLIDIETGRVIEFRNEDIEKLQDRIASELGCKLVGHKLELYGVPISGKKKQPRNGS